MMTLLPSRAKAATARRMPRSTCSPWLPKRIWVTRSPSRWVGTTFRPIGARRAVGRVQPAVAPGHAVAELIQRDVLPGLVEELLQHDRQRGLAGAGRSVQEDDLAGPHGADGIGKPRARQLRHELARRASPDDGFGRGLPELPDIALVAVRVGAVDAPLFPRKGTRWLAVEQTGAGSSVPAGIAARCALADLGLAPCAIPRRGRPPAGLAGRRGRQHQPCRRWPWPAVARGRISRAASASISKPAGASPRRCTRSCSRPRSGPLRAGGGDWPTLLFSAKEAVYKAVNPLTGQYIGFQEVEVDVDWVRREFRLRYVGAHAPSRSWITGLGHFAVASGYVLTVFAV
jgi:hypothetical protein